MLKLGLWKQSDAWILVKEIIKVTNTATANGDANNINQKVIFKSCTPFADRITKINSIQENNTKDIDVVISMYNLWEYSNNYSKTSWSSFHYYRDEPALNNDGDVVDFADNNTADSFKSEEKITCQTCSDNTKKVKIMIPLKYLNDFCRTH